MASLVPVSNQVRDSSCSSAINNTTRGCSKALGSLKKILHIISSVKPPPLCDLELTPKPGRGFDIDLNFSLVGPFWESGESENGDLSTCSFVGKEIESDLSRNGVKTSEGSSSDITNLEENEDSVKVDQDVGERRPFKEQNGSNDCFNMLIAAAELISSTEAESSSPSQDKDEKKTGTDNDNNNNNNAAAAAAATAMMITEPTTISESKKNTNTCTADLEDTSLPVVRSKRGRSQVLPYRYRDSILLLEPSKRGRPPKTKRRSR